MIAIELNLSCSVFEFWLYSYPAKKPVPLIEEDLAFSYFCVLLIFQEPYRSESRRASASTLSSSSVSSRMNGVSSCGR